MNGETRTKYSTCRGRVYNLQSDHSPHSLLILCQMELSLRCHIPNSPLSVRLQPPFCRHWLN